MKVSSGEQAAGHHDPLAADAIRKPAEEHEKGRAEHERRGDQEVGRLEIELQRVLQEEERVELPRVPDDALARSRAEQRKDDDAGVAPLAEAFRQGGPRQPALGLHLDEDRRFLEAQPDVDGHSKEDDGDQERQAPAPVAEGILAETEPAGKDHGEGQEESERRRRLDPARVVAALALRRVLGDIGRGAAVLAAESEALRKPQGHEQHGGPDADLRIGRQHADERGRQTHDDDRDQEGVLAADQVADAPENQCADRPHGKPCAESRKAREEGGRLIARRKEER